MLYLKKVYLEWTILFMKYSSCVILHFVISKGWQVCKYRICNTYRMYSMVYTRVSARFRKGQGTAGEKRALFGLDS